MVEEVASEAEGAHSREDIAVVAAEDLGQEEHTTTLICECIWKVNKV